MLSPIPLTAPDVLAFLSGTRTQIRIPITARNSLVDGRPSPKLFAALVWDERVYVDAGPSPAGNDGPYLHVPHRNGDSVHRVYPKWGPGDRLWVQETWGVVKGNGLRIVYRADGDPPMGRNGQQIVPMEWGASTSMPRTFLGKRPSRLDLDVLSVRAQHLHDITTDDIIAEGIKVPDVDYRVPERPDVLDAERDAYAREAYSKRWEEIYGAGSWTANGWVWAFTVKAEKQGASR